MKCALCGKKIETTFLNKIIGTYVKVNGKMYPVCRECQKKYSMEEIKSKF